MSRVFLMDRSAVFMRLCYMSLPRFYLESFHTEERHDFQITDAEAHSPATSPGIPTVSLTSGKVLKTC